MSPRTSIIALCLYATALLGGLKLLGAATLTWPMVLFPIWGLGIGLILILTLVALIIGATAKWL